MSDLLAVLAQQAVSYAWLWVDPEEPQRLVEVRIEGRRQHQEDLLPSRWVIQLDRSMVLNRSGEWEYEPLPSSRTDAFIARTRWDSPAEALAFIEATLPGWASSGEMPAVTEWKAFMIAWKARRAEQRASKTE